MNEQLKKDYLQARRMCAYIMPENCAPFMFSAFHLSMAYFYTGKDEEKRQGHLQMARFHNKTMEENNERYQTNWY